MAAEILMQTHRVYWWLTGISADRPGGPWWYRDFRSEFGTRRLLNDLRPFCLEIRLVTFDGPVPPYSPWNIEPPPDAEVWLTQETSERGGDA